LQKVIQRDVEDVFIGIDVAAGQVPPFTIAEAEVVANIFQRRIVNEVSRMTDLQGDYG